MAKQTATEVADYLIQRAIDDDNGDLLSNLKLQKLLYYAQGCYLAIYGEPLFDETVEAWSLGPVVPKVYHQLKAYGRQPIGKILGKKVSLSDDVADFLSVIHEKFGQFSASRLTGMTHREDPWQTNYESGKNAIIDPKAMQDFFKKSWIDPNIAVEADGFDDAIVARINKALESANDERPLSADEFEKWLEAV